MWDSPPAGANHTWLEVLSSPSSWATSTPSKPAGTLEACSSAWHHEHLVRQVWVKGTPLQDATPMLTRAWAKHSSTTASSVQTHSCYFSDLFYTTPSILASRFMLAESLLGKLIPFSCKNNCTRVAQVHANNSKWNVSDKENVPWGISPQSQVFCEKTLALTKFCKSFCKNFSYGEKANQKFFPSHLPCCHSSMLKKNLVQWTTQ